MPLSLDIGVIESFFSAFYGDAVGEQANLVLWSSRNKRSRWAGSLSEAAAYAEANAAASDLYFGVCLQDLEAAKSERLRRSGQSGMDFARGYASTALVVPGVWLDLDVAGDGHEKRGLPTCDADAYKILECLPFKPTIILSTGGGFHVYWLFEEPWELNTDQERARASAVIRGWQAMAINAGAEMGFAVDATHDLSRVLRPLGTINHKYGKTVELTEGDYSIRYNPSDFEDWATEIIPVGSVMPEKLEKLGNLHAEMQPPAEKLMAMLNLQPQFAATWKRDRKEFPSQSEYDMSLASMAIRAGWKESEVTALIVAHRKQGGENLKLDRPEYYARLLGKAKSGNGAEDAHERIGERVEAVGQGDSSAEEERGGFLTDLSALLGFPIRRVIKYVTDPPQYRLVLDEGTIHLGDVNTIINYTKFRASVAAVSGRLIRRFNGQQWDPVAQAILQAVEELDLGADSSAEQLVNEWLGEFLAQHRPSKDRDDAVMAKLPFYAHDGLPAFFMAEFRSWLGFARDEKMGRRQVATLLRSAGCTPRTVAYHREDGSHSTVHAWVVAPSIAASLPDRETSSASSETVVPF